MSKERENNSQTIYIHLFFGKRCALPSNASLPRHEISAKTIKQKLLQIARTWEIQARNYGFRSLLMWFLVFLGSWVWHLSCGFTVPSLWSLWFFGFGFAVGCWFLPQQYPFRPTESQHHDSNSEWKAKGRQAAAQERNPTLLNRYISTSKFRSTVTKSLGYSILWVKTLQRPCGQKLNQTYLCGS